MSRAWIIRMGPQEWKFSWTQAMEKQTSSLVSRFAKGPLDLSLFPPQPYKVRP